jgi:hypothetical protein
MVAPRIDKALIPIVGAGLGDTRRTSPPARNAGALSLSRTDEDRRWETTTGVESRDTGVLPAGARSAAVGGTNTLVFSLFNWLTPHNNIHGRLPYCERTYDSQRLHLSP